MNNEIQTKNTNTINLATVLSNIADFHIDPQHTSVNLKVINGMIFSFNWKSRKFDYSRIA